MFADDTTLYDSDLDLIQLQKKFLSSLCNLTEWCNCNRLDINWSKTYFMFITNKRVRTPISIIVADNVVQVVDTFKLLGVTLDNKLNFLK